MEHGVFYRIHTYKSLGENMSDNEMSPDEIMDHVRTQSESKRKPKKSLKKQNQEQIQQLQQQNMQMMQMCQELYISHKQLEDFMLKHFLENHNMEPSEILDTRDGNIPEETMEEFEELLKERQEKMEEEQGSDEQPMESNDDSSA